MTRSNILMAALLVGSCNQSALDRIPDASLEERMDVAEVNIRRAAAASTQAADRFERIEARVDDLERRLR